MVKVSRKELNRAKLAYRQHHALLKEFDYGFTHFEEFIGLNQHQRLEYHYGNNLDWLDVTELTKAKLGALKASKENIWVMLKAASAKYGKPPPDVPQEGDDSFFKEGKVIWKVD